MPETVAEMWRPRLWGAGIRGAGWKFSLMSETAECRTRLTTYLESQLQKLDEPRFPSADSMRNQQGAGTSEVSARTEPESHRFDPSTRPVAGTGAGPARHEARNGTPDRKINDEQDNSATQWRPGIEFHGVRV